MNRTDRLDRMDPTKRFYRIDRTFRTERHHPRVVRSTMRMGRAPAPSAAAPVQTH